MNTLTAGYTAPDAPQTSIGDNGRFGPEIGLVKRLNELNDSGNKIGVLKHAVGSASMSLWSAGSEGYTRLLNAISDGITKLTNLGYTYSIKGVVWWQGESDGNQDITSDYTSFISRLRSDLRDNYNVVGATEDQLPFVLTRGSTWGDSIETAANSDPYAALINAGEYGQNNFEYEDGYENDTEGGYAAVTAGGKVYVLKDGFVLNDKDNGNQILTYNAGTILHVWQKADAHCVIADDSVEYGAGKGRWRYYYPTDVGDDFNPAKIKVVSHFNTHIGSGANQGSKRYRLSSQNDMLSIGEGYADKMLNATNALTPLWDPSSISTRLWLDMNDETTFTLSNSNVTQISDKSGNDYSLSASGGSTITAIGNERNGKTILRFDSGSDYTSQTSIPFAESGIHRWFFVLKVTESDNHDCLVRYVKNSPTTSQIMMFNFSGNEFKGDFYFNPGDPGNDKLLGTSLPNLVNQWVMLSTEFDMSTNIAKLFCNGELYASAEKAAVGNIGGGNGSIQINNHPSNRIADSDWGEAIFTESITEDQTKKVEGYLAHKWGLAGELPEDHIYKSVPPII